MDKCSGNDHARAEKLGKRIRDLWDMKCWEFFRRQRKKRSYTGKIRTFKYVFFRSLDTECASNKDNKNCSNVQSQAAVEVVASTTNWRESVIRSIGCIDRASVRHIEILVKSERQDRGGAIGCAKYVTPTAGTLWVAVPIRRLGEP